MRVAVIGASGIGKQHAKWFHLEGCEVTAFAGRTEESVAKTRQTLRGLFPFSGRGFTSVEAMLEDTRPDIAVIASPPECHGEHALLALEAGCHVYCEKPLVWSDRALENPAEASVNLIAQGRALLEEATRAGKVVGVNTQYAAAVPDYLTVTGCDPAPLPYPDSFYMKMESKGTGRRKEFGVIWADLASHPLSLLSKWCPDGAIVDGSVRLLLRRQQNLCHFDFAVSDGRTTAVEIELGQITEGTPARDFGINGRIASYSGRNDPDGVYRSYLTYQGRETITEDFVQRSVRAFTQSVSDSALRPIVSGEVGLRNLELQLQILQLAERVAE